MANRANVRLSIRPLRTGDRSTLETWFASLSDRSRELRFFSPTPRLTSTLATQLLDVDGRHRYALVAEVRRLFGFEAVGLAHLAEIEPGRAEIALAVADAWQGRGIGRRLLMDLGSWARAAGYAEVQAVTLPGNRTPRSLLRSVFPGTRQYVDGDVVELNCPLDPAAALEPLAA